MIFMVGARNYIAATIRCMFGGGGSIQLARVFGIRVGVEPSWFLILFLIIWSLTGYYGDLFPDEAPARSCWRWSRRCCSSAASLLHELGHAVVAIRNGIKIEGIDLWLFGGVAKLSRATPTRPARSSGSRRRARRSRC